MDPENAWIELAVDEARRIQKIESETANLPRKYGRYIYDPPGYAASWDASIIQKNMLWRGLAERFEHQVNMTMPRSKKWPSHSITLLSDSISLTPLGRELLLRAAVGDRDHNPSSTA